MRSNQQAYERIETEVYASAEEAVQTVAGAIVELIQTRAAAGEKVVLGLATGSTPIPLYRELIRYHKEEGLSFANVITFNLDEYYGLSKEHPESYYRFMRDQLFEHIDVPENQIHVPDGMVAKESIFDYCQEFEEAIRAAGGLDMQILGIGRTGHIGFNEPGSSIDSRTRRITLDSLTRVDAARDFQGENNVPRHALTMGVGTIMDARKVYLLAWGQSKARVVQKAVEEAPSESLPASYLQKHREARVILDQSAATELTRFKKPWLVGFPEWTPRLVRQAVTELSLTLGKPILKLLDQDYLENGLAELLTEQGPAYNLNIRIFNEAQHTITGWPAGKANVDDSHRPERAEPACKRVLVLSPEPKDDVTAMGSTLNRLVSQGHTVKVAYMTSGSLSVPDAEARWTMRLLEQLEAIPAASFLKVAGEQLARKSDYEQDTAEIRRLKACVRRNEAEAALGVCGLKQEQLEFLDLPFYEGGRYRRFTTTEEDVAILARVLEDYQPHQIFMTGYKAEPNGVEGKCYGIFANALQRLAGAAWMQDCWIWLYPYGDRAWAPHEIDMAVPSSPDELSRKSQAIYQHRSQRSQTPVGADHAEEWEQAKSRNRHMADQYDALGLAEYEAIESFVRWYPES